MTVPDNTTVVGVIDTATGAAVTSIPIAAGFAISGLVPVPGTTIALQAVVDSSNATHLVAIDTQSATVTGDVIDLPGRPVTVFQGDRPYTSDGTRLLVATATFSNTATLLVYTGRGPADRDRDLLRWRAPAPSTASSREPSMPLDPNGRLAELFDRRPGQSGERNRQSHRAVHLYAVTRGTARRRGNTSAAN